VKLFIFDLDNTLTPHRESSTAAFEEVLLAGVREKCRLLRSAGALLAIASNQGGISRGLSPAAVERQLGWVSGELGVAAYRFAWEPERKKPGPAMLRELMAELGALPAETCFVGDAESDRLAAEAAGVSFIYAGDFFAAGPR
jgi:HAD superfamily hydrolase (TIGR01662 family)